MSRLDQDDVGQTDGVDKLGKRQSFSVINEPGLYTLVLRSDKPEAKRFKRWITHDVIPQIRKTGGYTPRGALPHRFVRRFNDNWDRVERGYFSVISELYIRLYGRFEQQGHILAETSSGGTEVRPDNSVGKYFVAWLKKHKPERVRDVRKYMHLFPNGYQFEANQYPNDLLPDFIRFVEEDWLPNQCERYLKPRDPAAIAYLPKVIAGPATAAATRRISFPKTALRRSS
jgi:BRO family, N-terminal domain